MKCFPIVTLSAVILVSSMASANPFVKSDGDNSQWKVAQERNIQEMRNEIESLKMMLDQRLSEDHLRSEINNNSIETVQGPGIPEKGLSEAEGNSKEGAVESKDDIGVRLIINGVKISVGEDNKYKIGASR